MHTSVFAKTNSYYKDYKCRSFQYARCVILFHVYIESDTTNKDSIPSNYNGSTPRSQMIQSIPHCNIYIL